MSVALVKIQVRNDTAQAWAAANPLLSDGEPGAESNTGRLKIGNGIDRWLELPYVGGDGSGGGSVNPISGTIDGGIYTGNPRTSEAGPPLQPAASKAIVDGYEVLVLSWGPAAVDDPSSASITQYAVEWSLNPTDDSSWFYGGQSNTVGDPVLNYAAVTTPRPTDSNNDYYYRVKAVLDNGGAAEWGYSQVYRHFKSIEPMSFSLSATKDSIGSTSEDNVTVISVEGFTGGGPTISGPNWSYPAVTGLVYTEDGQTLTIENTSGSDTVSQALFVQCEFNSSYMDPNLPNGDLLIVDSKVETIQITVEDTTVDPGPNPNPNPTPGDTLPLFNWDLVEDATDPPPGLVTKPEGFPGSFGQWPQSYQPKRYGKWQSLCNGNNCINNYPCQSGTGCEICEVQYATEWVFTDFTIIWTSPNWQQSGINLVPDPVTQFKKLSIAGGSACISEPMLLNTAPATELQLPNPLVNVWNQEAGDPTGGLNTSISYSPYQVIDRLDLNGSVASYAILYHAEDYNNQGQTSYPISCTGAMIITRDGGSSFKFVDVRSTGFTWTHFGGPDLPGEPNGMPKMLVACKSATNERDVLVGMFDYQSGDDSVQQFYYTDDHITWRPCDNRDRITNTANKIWYDAATDAVYATDATHTGENVNGVYSYYKSEKS